METISMETIPASKNVIIDLAFGGLKVIAGQKYEKGDIVSTALIYSVIKLKPPY